MKTLPSLAPARTVQPFTEYNVVSTIQASRQQSPKKKYGKRIIMDQLLVQNSDDQQTTELYTRNKLTQ